MINLTSAQSRYGSQWRSAERKVDLPELLIHKIV